MIPDKSYTILLLAAGSSSRLGQPKQLLPFGKTSLLEHMIDLALQTKAANIVVIINPQLEKIKEKERTIFIINEDAANGISTSIKKGIETITNLFPQTSAAIIMACDQPFIQPGILNELIHQHELTGKGIIAARYAGTYGIPALFNTGYFAKLAAINGDKGAKSLMSQYLPDRAFVDFPQGEIDLDTPEDLKNIGIKQ